MSRRERVQEQSLVCCIHAEK